jgi:NADH:ubiquinone oxidoreductase subunit K
MILLLIAAASVVIALMLIFNLYDNERKLEKIDAAHSEDQHKSRDGQQLQ